MKNALIAFAIIAAALSSKAFAAKDPVFGANLGLLYSSASDSQSNSSTTVTTTGMNFHAGFYPFPGFIMGLAHYSFVQAVTASTTEGATKFSFTRTGTTQGQGIHLGFNASNGFTVGLSYLINPSYADDTEKYSGNSAIVLQGGWNWDVGDWKFGFTIMRSEFSYTTHTVDNIDTDLTQERKETLMVPMGNVGFYL